MTYSPDFRQKFLQKLAEGLSVRKVAQLFDINFMTVQKWKTNPVPKSQQIHPPKKISKDALLADVQAYPTDFLYERANALRWCPRKYAAEKNQAASKQRIV